MSTAEEQLEYTSRLFVTIKTKDGRVWSQGPYLTYVCASGTGTIAPILAMMDVSRRSGLTAIMVIEEMPKVE